MTFQFTTMGQCNETFYHSYLMPLHGNHRGNIALKHRMMVLPWNGGN
jgi:hypothetical protein